jgi:crotonobetainyl-CoA:carnitine CoA-transferase CaiB-like acyl-CoA transferase
LQSAILFRSAKQRTTRRTRVGTAPTEAEGAADPFDRHGPLRGLRVLDCSTILAGPLICQVLGDFGADVIKVEHPNRPDGMRGHGHAVDGHGLWWKEVGRNKRTIAVDLSTPDGADLLLELARTADVLVENFRPGTLERWGLGWDVLHEANSRLVLVRVTGFGQEGPYSGRPAFGTLVEAMSGFAHLTGQADGPPTLPAFGLADSIAGMAGVGAVMMALYHRDASGGEGQFVDLSLLEPIMTAVGPAPTIYDKSGILLQRQGNRSSNNAPRNLYATADGHWLAISTSTDAIAERVLRLVGHPEVVEQPWFATGAERAEHADQLDEYVGSWIRERSREQVLEEFERAGAAVAPVYSPADLVVDPQVQDREMLVRVPDEDLGELLQHNVLFRMSATPGGIRTTGREHAADTDDVLGNELHLDPSRIAELRAHGVIR